MLSVRTYVRPHFSNVEKTTQQKTMIATGVTMGLAEWIIDDTCLVFVVFPTKMLKYVSKEY